MLQNLMQMKLYILGLYDLTSLGLSVVDASGAGLGRVIDSAGTIELSQSDALNAFVSLKVMQTFQHLLFMLRRFRENQLVKYQN